MSDFRCGRCEQFMINPTNCRCKAFQVSVYCDEWTESETVYANSAEDAGVKAVMEKDARDGEFSFIESGDAVAYVVQGCDLGKDGEYISVLCYTKPTYDVGFSNKKPDDVPAFEAWGDEEE